jgi:hypothetical protein
MAEFVQKDFSAGMLDVNVPLAPSNSVGLLMNCDVDAELGSAVSRLGRATIDSQLVDGVAVLGIVQHIDQADSTKNRLFAMVNDATATNSDIYALTGTPSIPTGGNDFTASLKAYFLNYSGETLVLNGTNNPRAYNSTEFITTGGVFDLATMLTYAPNCKYSLEFLDRVYLWGQSTNPYRLFYSGVLTSNAISWSVGQGYVDIEPEDSGGEPTGLGKVPGYILIFKRRSMHRWNYTSAFPESLVSIGAYSQESIVSAGGVCAFYSDSNENEKGFYMTDGDRPICISKHNNRPIKKWTDAIGATATVAGYATENVFAWSVGDLTVDGETYSNVVLRYNRKLNQWSMHTYPTEFRCFALYVVSGVNSIVGGDDDGTVYRINKSATYTDAVTTTTRPFVWKVRQHFMTYGDNRIKTTNNKAVVRGKNISDSRLNFYVNDDLSKPISQKGNRSNGIISEFNVSQGVRGNTIAAEVSGISGGAQSYVREIDLISITADKNHL